MNIAGWSSSVARRAHNPEGKVQKVNIAEWSSPVARRAHNPKVVGSNPASATKKPCKLAACKVFFLIFPAFSWREIGGKSNPFVLYERSHIKTSFLDFPPVSLRGAKKG